MNFISSHLDAILFALFCLTAFIFYRIGRASAQDEIDDTLIEIDELREVIHAFKTSQQSSFRVGKHPAGIRLVRSE